MMRSEGDADPSMRVAIAAATNAEPRIIRKVRTNSGSGSFATRRDRRTLAPNPQKSAKIDPMQVMETANESNLARKSALDDG
jgi:hypothetical protein